MTWCTLAQKRHRGKHWSWIKMTAREAAHRIRVKVYTVIISMKKTLVAMLILCPYLILYHRPFTYTQKSKSKDYQQCKSSYEKYPSSVFCWIITGYLQFTHTSGRKKLKNYRITNSTASPSTCVTLTWANTSHIANTCTHQTTEWGYFLERVYQPHNTKEEVLMGHYIKSTRSWEVWERVHS